MGGVVVSSITLAGCGLETLAVVVGSRSIGVTLIEAFIWNCFLITFRVVRIGPILSLGVVRDVSLSIVSNASLHRLNGYELIVGLATLRVRKDLIRS